MGRDAREEWHELGPFLRLWCRRGTHLLGSTCFLSVMSSVRSSPFAVLQRMTRESVDMETSDSPRSPKSTHLTFQTGSAARREGNVECKRRGTAAWRAEGGRAQRRSLPAAGWKSYPGGPGIREARESNDRSTNGAESVAA